MYKITCTDPSYTGDKYDGVRFKSVAYTEDKKVADRFANNKMHHGGVKIFSVEEVEQENE